MKIKHLFETPSNWAKMSKDPRASKLLAIAFKQDKSIPGDVRAKLGPRPKDEEIVIALGKLIDATFANTDYGDLSKDGKFDEWIGRQYMNGALEFEDIEGEAVDTLGGWKALSKRGLLKDKHQDFNKFDLPGIQNILRLPHYTELLRKVKDQEKLEAAKRDQKFITLIDNDKFNVVIPLNYGACYRLNNAEGVQATFCTGGSEGLRYFSTYSSNGPLIFVTDKENINDIKGKWQIHAPTGQFYDASQRNRYQSEREFRQRFPGLMEKIIDSMKDKKDEIETPFKLPDNRIIKWNVDNQITNIKNSFPSAFEGQR